MTWYLVKHRTTLPYVQQALLIRTILSHPDWGHDFESCSGWQTWQWAGHLQRWTCSLLRDRNKKKSCNGPFGAHSSVSSVTHTQNLALRKWCRVFFFFAQQVKKSPPPHLLWNSNVHYRVHNSPSLDSILDQFSTDLTLWTILILPFFLRLGLPRGIFP